MSGAMLSKERPAEHVNAHTIHRVKKMTHACISRSRGVIHYGEKTVSY